MQPHITHKHEKHHPHILTNKWQTFLKVFAHEATREEAAKKIWIALLWRQAHSYIAVDAEHQQGLGR